MVNTPAREYATFAGGCFWCMEQPFDSLEGVISVTVGYMGGSTPNPTYEQVCTGSSGHAEVVQIVFNPSVISYQTLLEAFWQNIDPTQKNGQFCDIGSQYRTTIFTHSAAQQAVAEASLHAIQQLPQFAQNPLHTEITTASKFYPAEEYHQKYYRKNPMRYTLYQHGSGRKNRLKQLWQRKILENNG